MPGGPPLVELGEPLIRHLENPRLCDRPVQVCRLLASKQRREIHICLELLWHAGVRRVVAIDADLVRRAACEMQRRDRMRVPYALKNFADHFRWVNAQRAVRTAEGRVLGPRKASLGSTEARTREGVTLLSG